MTAALAEGLAKGIPGQRADGRSSPTPVSPPLPPEKANTMWYVGGAAVLAVAGALLWRSW